MNPANMSQEPVNDYPDPMFTVWDISAPGLHLDMSPSNMLDKLVDSDLEPLLFDRDYPPSGPAFNSPVMNTSTMPQETTSTNQESLSVWAYTPQQLVNPVTNINYMPTRPVYRNEDPTSSVWNHPLPEPITPPMDLNNLRMEPLGNYQQLDNYQEKLLTVSNYPLSKVINPAMNINNMLETPVYKNQEQLSIGWDYSPPKLMNPVMDMRNVPEQLVYNNQESFSTVWDHSPSKPMNSVMYMSNVSPEPLGNYQEASLAVSTNPLGEVINPGMEMQNMSDGTVSNNQGPLSTVWTYPSDEPRDPVREMNGPERPPGNYRESSTPESYSFLQELADPIIVKACIRGDLSAVLQFYEELGDAKNYNPDTSLAMAVKAARYGHPAIMTEILKTGIQIDEKIFRMAVESGSTELVLLLISHGLPVAQFYRWIQIALFIAIRAKDIPMMALSLDHGADPNFRTPEKYFPARKPLSYAVMVDSAEAVQLLLDRGARIDGSGALRAAGSYGCLEPLRTIVMAQHQHQVEAGGPIRLEDSNFKRELAWTLMNAIKHRYLDIIQYVVLFIDPHRDTGYGYSPFVVACDKGDAEVLALLNGDGPGDNSMGSFIASLPAAETARYFGIL